MWLDLQFDNIVSNASGSINLLDMLKITNAIGDINKSRFKESNRSFSFVRSNPCNTDFRARANVAIKHARNPQRWKSGSLLLARTIPTTTGTNVIYTSAVSFFLNMHKESNAVKKGVVAPIA